MPSALVTRHRRTFSRLARSGVLVLLAACQGGNATNPEKPEPPPPPPPPACEFFGLATNPPVVTVEMGSATTLTASIAQRNCSNLTVVWASETPAIATVSQAGVVTGVWPGTTRTTASLRDSSAWSEVNVSPVFPLGRVQLAHLPVDPGSVHGFFGLGELNVFPKDHGAFVTPPSGWNLPPTIPVYTPGDGWIEGLIYDSIPDWGRDLSMRIRYSTTMTTNFGHMNDFAPDIWAAAGTLERGYGVDNRVWIPVSSGQVVGLIGRGISMDFRIDDAELQLNFVNPARYPSHMLNAGYYFDYFDEPLKSQLRAIAIRQDEPRGGKIDYDVAGRIIGNWFLEGTTGWDLTKQLAIVYDFIDGTRIAISDGSPISDVIRAAPVYWVDGNAPRPENVGQADGLVKYEIRQRWFRDATLRQHVTSDILGTFLVEMIEPGRIRVETVLGKSPAEISGFSGAARIYVR